MNKRWLILPLITLAVSSFAQTDSTYLNVINRMIRKVQPTRTIHYGQSIIDLMPSGCDEVIKKEIFSRDSTNTFKLASRERKYLLRQLNAHKNSHWSDHLFADSKVIADSMDIKIQKLNRALVDSVKRLDNKYDYAKNGFLYRTYWGFWFSRPVYLRNKSILIFHFIWYHNSAGSNGLYIYRKEGDTYVEWLDDCVGWW